MANFVTISVPNARLIASVYDRIAVYRSATYSGTYTEITAVGTRIVLDADEMTYIYVDPSGLTSSFYRYVFVNSTTAAVSSQSFPFAGVGDMAVPVLTADELRKNFLFGIPLEDGTGNAMDDSTLDFYIAAATTYVEKMVDIIIRPTVFAGEHPQPADRHDFYQQDYNRYMWMKLLHVPVISVEEVRFTLPSSTIETTFLDEWLIVDEFAGVLQVVPGSGQTTALALGLSTMWLPVTQGLLNFIPEVFQVDYTAGFRDGLIPADLKQLIGYLAAIDVLAIVGDLLFGPGVAGSDVGLDVLMTRLKTTRSDTSSIFGARISQYQARVDKLISEQRLIYRGVPLMAG